MLTVLSPPVYHQLWLGRVGARQKLATLQAEPAGISYYHYRTGISATSYICFTAVTTVTDYWLVYYAPCEPRLRLPPTTYLHVH